MPPLTTDHIEDFVKLGNIIKLGKTGTPGLVEKLVESNPALTASNYAENGQSGTVGNVEVLDGLAPPEFADTQSSANGNQGRIELSDSRVNPDDFEGFDVDTMDLQFDTGRTVNRTSLGQDALDPVVDEDRESRFSVAFKLPRESALILNKMDNRVYFKVRIRVGDYRKPHILAQLNRVQFARGRTNYTGRGFAIVNATGRLSVANPITDLDLSLIHI